MSAFAWMSIMAVLLALVLAGIGRIVAGPTRADRLLATQLFGTIGVGALCAAAAWQETAALLDVALVFAFLAAVTTTAYAYISVISAPARPGPPTPPGAADDTP